MSKKSLGKAGVWRDERSRDVPGRGAIAIAIRLTGSQGALNRSQTSARHILQSSWAPDVVIPARVSRAGVVPLFVGYIAVRERKQRSTAATGRDAVKSGLCRLHRLEQPRPCRVFACCAGRAPTAHNRHAAVCCGSWTCLATWGRGATGPAGPARARRIRCLPISLCSTRRPRSARAEAIAPTSARASGMGPINGDGVIKGAQAAARLARLEQISRQGLRATRSDLQVIHSWSGSTSSALRRRPSPQPPAPSRQPLGVCLLVGSGCLFGFALHGE